MVRISVKGVSVEGGRVIHNGSSVVSLEVSGHALYAQKGSDIVCAGVSVLQQAFARTLAVRNVPFQLGNNDEKIALQCDWQNMSEEQRGVILSAFEMVIHGLMMMAESHPDHVAITFE